MESEFTWTFKIAPNKSEFDITDIEVSRNSLTINLKINEMDEFIGII